MYKKLGETIGLYLGEYLISHRIPSLSHQHITRNVIQITIGEADKRQELEDAWYNKTSSIDLDDNDEFNELIKYEYYLKEKYLPHVVKLKLLEPLDLSNKHVVEGIKDGLINCLYHWDHCDWSLEREDVWLEEMYVTLKLKLSPPATFTGKEWIEIKTKQK